MATTVIEKGQPGSRARFTDSFVLHKLMSLTGVFPIGFFMIQHLVANSYALRGEVPFNTVVGVFGYLPFVAVMEWAIVFIPILFHSIYGFMITAEMRMNTGTYQYGRNYLYTLQRVSGVIAFAYIAYHTYSTWGLKKIFELSTSHEAGFRAISYDAMMYRFAAPWYTAIYIIGIVAAAFHLGNGLFNFGIRWGITVGAMAQKISAYLWGSVGFGLTVIGIWTSLNFYAMSQTPLPKFGNQTVQQRFSSLDDLVAHDTAPADQTPTAKPVNGPGGVVASPESAQQQVAPTATTP